MCVCSWIVVSNRPWLYEQNVDVLQETKTVYPLRAHGSIPIFDEVRVAHLFTSCVMSALCCHCLWIVYSWLSLRFSLSTIINNFYFNRTCFRRSFLFKKSGFIIRCLQWFKVFVSFVIFIMTRTFKSNLRLLINPSVSSNNSFTNMFIYYTSPWTWI